MWRRSVAATVAGVAVLLTLSCVAASASSSASALLGGGGGAQEHVRVEFLPDAAAAPGDFYADASKLVPMTLGNGSRYHCRLPGRAVSHEDDELLWRRHLQKVRDHALPEHQLSQLHAVLRDQCFTQPAGWWTYKLCWGQGLRQFHLDAQGRPEAEYVLGQGPLKHIEDGAEDELLFDVDAFDPTKARLLAEWFNGTECDLTKEQRQMQLLLYCADGRSSSGSNNRNGNGGAGAAMHATGGIELSVTEPLSCQYQVTLRHPAFCAVPELKTRRQPEVVVQCIELPHLEAGDGKDDDDRSAVVASTVTMGGSSP